MKNKISQIVFVVILELISLFAVNTAFAQVPDAINFQAIARDVNGDILAETEIMVQLSILDGNPSGNVVYREIRSLTTNEYGSFSFQIGRDPFMSEGVFADIDWAGGDKFLKIDYDPSATLNFELTLGTIEFVTVPFAFAARDVVYIDASGAIDGDILVYNSSTGKFEPEQQTATNVEWDDIQNKPVLDGSETHIIAGTNVTITGSGTAEDPYIVNAIGSGLTLTAPTANVLPASNIQSIYAQLNGIINANGLTTTVIFEWGTSIAYGNIANAIQSPIIGTTDLIVSANLSSLQVNTTYHYRIKAINAVGIIFSDDMSFTTGNSEPQLSTNEVTDIMALSATCGGNITYDGGSSVTTRGICWSTSHNPTTADTYVASGEGTGSFNINMTGLMHNTTYYVRAYATNAVGTTYGNEISFTTLSGVVSLTTIAISDILAFSASSGGNITNDGGSPVTTRGICWSTSHNPTTANTYVESEEETGSFNINMTGLTHNTTYYVRAYATNSVGTTYGNEVSFTTLSGVVSLTTTGISSITEYTAVSGGNITADGGTSISAKGVCWNTTHNPTTSNFHTVDGTGTDDFVSELNNLSPLTTYYVRAYATNEIGTSYGQEKSFTTLGSSDDCDNSNYLPFSDYGVCGEIAFASIDLGTATTSFTNPAPSCANFSESTNDLWCKLIVPTGVSSLAFHMFNSNITNPFPNASAPAMAVYRGTCGSLTLLDCFESNGGFMQNGEIRWETISGLTPGETLYIRVWDENNLSQKLFIAASVRLDMAEDDCNTPTELSEGGCNILSTGGDITAPEQCGWNTTDNSVFYYFTVDASDVQPVTVTISYSTCYSNDNTSELQELQVAIYQWNGSDCSGIGGSGSTYMGCANGTGTVVYSDNLAPGDYILAIDGISTASGNSLCTFDIQINN